METANDRNPEGTEWFNAQMYSAPHSDHICPEEYHQVASLPRTLLLKELSKRLDPKNDKEITWAGKTVNFSGVSDDNLLHHIGLHLRGLNNVR